MVCFEKISRVINTKKKAKMLCFKAYFLINLIRTIKIEKLEHLSEIYNSYNTFIIDLWGVMHNGIALNSKAIEVADNLLKNLKKLFFSLTHLGLA